MGKEYVDLLGTLSASEQEKTDKMAKHDSYAEPSETDKVKSEVFKTKAPFKRKWSIFRDGRRLTVRTEDEWQRLFKDKSKNDRIRFGEIVMVGDCLEKFSDNMGHPSAHKFSDFFEKYEPIKVFSGEPVSMRYFVSERQLGELGRLCHILSVPLSAIMCYRMTMYMSNNGFHNDALRTEAKSFERLVESRCIRLINLMYDVLVPCKQYRIVRPDEFYLNQALDLLRHLINLYVEGNDWDKVRIQNIIVELNKDIELSIKGYDVLVKRHKMWMRGRKARYGVDVAHILTLNEEQLAELRASLGAVGQKDEEMM